MTIEEVRKLFKGNPGYDDSTYVCTTLNDVTDNVEPVGTIYSCKD